MNEKEISYEINCFVNNLKSYIGLQVEKAIQKEKGFEYLTSDDFDIEDRVKKSLIRLAKELQ